MRGDQVKRTSVLSLLILGFGFSATGATAPPRSPAEQCPGTAAASLRRLEPARAVPSPPPDQVVLECGPPANGGDRISNYGFYVPSLPADRLKRVELNLISWTAGEFRIALEARSDAFDGPLVGIATAVVNFPNSNPVTVPFDFLGAPVLRDQRVTFQFSLPDGGDPVIFFDTGPCIADPHCAACGGRIIETIGTSPPLGGFARNSVYAKIFSPPCAVHCVGGGPEHALTGSEVSFGCDYWSDDCAGDWTLDWDFGDGSHSDQPSPTHAYTSPGVFGWTLTVNRGGSACSTTGTIRVGSMLFASPAGSNTTCSQAVPCGLATALSQAQPGDTVALAGGTYTAAGSEVAKIEKGLALLGKWDGVPAGPPSIGPDNPPSILDGEDARRVVSVKPGAFPLLDSVTLTRGLAPGNGAGVLAEDASLSMTNAVVSGCLASLPDTNTSGGGIYLTGGTLLLEGCSFESNVVTCSTCGAPHGGAVYAQGAQSVTIVSCGFDDNTAWFGGGIYLDGSPFYIDACRFRGGHSAYGAGIFIQGESGTIRRTVFLDNSASDFGGALDLEGCDVEFSQNTMERNSGWKTACIYGWVANLKLTNNIFTDNHPNANGASAIQIKNSQATFLHNTIARNVGQSGGTGIEITGGTAVLVNTIIAGQSYGLIADAGSTVTADHTLWGEGAWTNNEDTAGSGTLTHTADIHGDPLFVDPDNGNYHIAVGSAAQDSGANAGVILDIDENPRPMGAGYDIGADEILFGAPLAASSGLNVSSGLPPLDVAFSGGYTGGAPTYTFDWDFGDGTLHSTEQSPHHIYTTPGTFQPVFTVRDGYGATATSDPHVITVTSLCTLDCSASVPASARAGVPVPFASTATPDHCTGAATFLWTFGDGSTSAEQNPSHTYLSSGSFNWTLTVTAEGITCTRSGSITIAPGLPGDCDGDGTVSIGEVQKAINMFLGTLAPGCGADCNGDGTVSIGEVQKVINAFLGLPSSC